MSTKDFEERVLSLSERIFPMVSRMLGNRENAEDAVQEIMIKLWDQRGKIENHPNVNGFAFLTARNYCLDLLKKKSPDVGSSDIAMKMIASETSQHQVEWKELNLIIDKLLESLPAQQREIIIMRDLDGFEFSEIATVTNLTVEHVRVLLSRARKQVCTKLKTIYSYEQGKV